MIHRDISNGLHLITDARSAETFWAWQEIVRLNPGRHAHAACEQDYCPPWRHVAGVWTQHTDNTSSELAAILDGVH